MILVTPSGALIVPKTPSGNPIFSTTPSGNLVIPTISSVSLVATKLHPEPEDLTFGRESDPEQNDSNGESSPEQPASIFFQLIFLLFYTFFFLSVCPFLIFFTSIPVIFLLFRYFLISVS
jgi:hypothetical protein